MKSGTLNTSTYNNNFKGSLVISYWIAPVNKSNTSLKPSSWSSASYDSTNSWIGDQRPDPLENDQTKDSLFAADLDAFHFQYHFRALAFAKTTSSSSLSPSLNHFIKDFITL